MQSKNLALCAVILPLGFAASALAQTTAPAQPAAPAAYELSGTSISGASTAPATAILTTPVHAGAAPFKTESGVYLYPSAFLGAGRNDNILGTNTNQISSGFVSFAPQIVAEMMNKGDRYTVLVKLDDIRYNSSEADNVSNSEFKVAGDNYFSSRARAGWAVGRVNGSDARGSTQRPIGISPDLWHSNNIDGRFIYGAPEASGRLEADLGSHVKNYDNNRSSTITEDQTIKALAARGLLRVGTRSLALLEYRQDQADYTSAASTTSNTERRYYVGFTWEATAATTGIVKIGRMTKDFDFAGKSAYSGGSWDATVRWLPLTYSAVDLTTSRYTADPTGYGEYTLNTGTNVTWNHKWTQSLSTRVAAGSLGTDFIGTTRSDTAKTYSLAANYSVLRWLSVGADFARTDNSSSTPSAAYKRNISMLTLNASL